MLYFFKLALLPQSLNIFRPLISMYVLNVTSGDRLENTIGEFLYLLQILTIHISKHIDKSIQ